jgi:hypothetical protein
LSLFPHSAANYGTILNRSLLAGEAEVIALDASNHLRLGAPVGDPFSISARHKSKNARRMIATIAPLELAGLAAT